MKNTIIGILAILFVGYIAINEYNKEEIVAPCGYDKSFVIESFQEWLTSAIEEKDRRIKDSPIQIKDLAGVVEYNSIPEIMKIPLYEDLKDSRVCKATLIIDYTPNEDKESLEQVIIRFQKVLTSSDKKGYRSTNISVSGFDVKEMGEQGLELFKKHNKDKKS